MGLNELHFVPTLFKTLKHLFRVNLVNWPHNLLIAINLVYKKKRKIPADDDIPVESCILNDHCAFYLCQFGPILANLGQF